MAALENTRYGDLCRLCATKTASAMVLGINIFEDEGIIRQISKKIETCLPIRVHEGDELPKIICENCLYKLELFFDFRERCLRTEGLLVDLYKEISSVRVQDQETTINVVTMDPNDLIMVQQHQLLNEHNMPNVEEIDLSQLSQREGIISEHEMILNHHTVNMNTHSLDSIELNHQELTNQDLSNHSLQTQESLLVDSSNTHSIPENQFADNNLDLIQQQHLLSDQFKFQHDLHVNISQENVTEIDVSKQGTDQMPHNEQSFHSGETVSDIEHNHNMNYTEPLTDENSLTVDSHLSDVSVQNRYVDEKSELSKAESLKQDDSNSRNSIILNEEGLTNIIDSDKQIYVLQIKNSMTAQRLVTGDNEWFCCNICGKPYEQKTEFEAHYESHFFKCDICLAVFTNNDILNRHRKEVHGSSPENKPIKPRLKKQILQVRTEDLMCPEILSGDSDFEHDTGQVEEEEEEVDDPEPVTPEKTNGKKAKPKVCKDCGKIYKTNYKLMEHMRKHTGEKPYKCRSCDKAFRSKIGLAQHEAIHTGQYEYSCPTCGKGFQCKSYLMVHQRVHSDIKPYPCTTCGRNFKTKQSLLDHTNRHLGVKPYMCETCGRGFITKGLCKAHQKIHTGLDNRKYSCKICSKKFVSKSYLQTHLRIHTGEKPFMCEVCGKGFVTRVDLRIHSTLHTGEKSYVCEICGKAFARRDALRCHRRSHTGERPYSCEICGQTFTQFTPMAIHRRLHTGERPYACETCGKAFVSRSTMMAHAKKHVR